MLTRKTLFLLLMFYIAEENEELEEEVEEYIGENRFVPCMYDEVVRFD
jgi:hypothetical protein